MSAAGHRKQIRGAIAALQADIAGWQKQIAATEILVEQLATRVGGAEGGTLPRTGTRTAVPPAPKRRRRRRQSARTSRTVPRNSAQIRRRKRPKPDVIEPVQVAAPVKAVRGAVQFADQLAELEKIRAGIAAGGNSKAAHALRVRGDAVLREMAGRPSCPIGAIKPHVSAGGALLSGPRRCRGRRSRAR